MYVHAALARFPAKAASREEGLRAWKRRARVVLLSTRLRRALRGLVRVREGVEEGLASMMCAMVDWVSGADGGVYRMRVVDGLRGLELGERRRDGVVKSWARSKRLRA
jgi:hypothetical protein